MLIHIDNSETRAPGLTPRQLTVVRLLADGRSAKHIAHSIGISMRTVQNHIDAARRTTRTPNVTALVAKAIRQKWIS